MSEIERGRERHGNRINRCSLRLDRLGMLLLRVCRDLPFPRIDIGHSKKIASTSSFILFQLTVGNLTFLSQSLFSRGTVQLLNGLQ